jgi:energy-coupling factor transport system ATP-binding protein
VEAFAVEHLTFFYPTRQAPALDGVDLLVGQGEFVVLCGPSGCGKTTLLRHLKPSLAPHGRREGRIRYAGTPLEAQDPRSEAADIGFVMQGPDDQMVADRVYHELAFGLEGLGHDSPTIRLRVAEMASFLGIQTWFHRQVSELSGGQKQLLALASVMAMQPRVLICDEPTGQLDPIAAAEFLQTLGRVNRELGTTVILTEHRLEEALPLASRVVVMERGRIVADGAPREVAEQLRLAHSGMFRAMSAPVRVWAAVPNGLPCPLTVRDGREWLDEMLGGRSAPDAAAPAAALGSDAPPALAPDAPSASPLPAVLADSLPVPVALAASTSSSFPAVELKEVWFRYGKDSPDVLQGLSLKACPGQVTAVLGGNGTGKTTMLSLVAGLQRPYRGTVLVEGQDLRRIPAGRLFDRLLGVLPQDPQTLFVGRTVADDLGEMLAASGLSREEREEQVRHMAGLCRLDGLLASHPYDLSGGEQQRAALAKVLLLRPRILLLDEPTKGFDADFKVAFAALLRTLTAAGAAVLMVSHDREFCAEHADRCALVFEGEVVAEGPPQDFFSGNSFYTTAANRMARHVFPKAVTVSDVVEGLAESGHRAGEDRCQGGGDRGDGTVGDSGDCHTVPAVTVPAVTRQVRPPCPPVLLPPPRPLSSKACRGGRCWRRPWCLSPYR